MTERVSIVHEFDCSEKSFWETFLNNDYNTSMFVGRMRFTRWDIVKMDKKDDVVERIVEVEPNIGQLPGPVKKVIGDTIGYKEEGRLDLRRNRYELKVLPAKLADKIQVTGVQYTEALGENRCRRFFEATINVKIFGIGGMIEKQIAADLTRSYDVGARFTADYLKQHEIR